MPKYHPATCKQSIRLGDVYVCKWECAPCNCTKVCALEQIDSAVETFSEIVKAAKEKAAKEKTT